MYIRGTALRRGAGAAFRAFVGPISTVFYRLWRSILGQYTRRCCVLLGRGTYHHTNPGLSNMLPNQNKCVSQGRPIFATVCPEEAFAGGARIWANTLIRRNSHIFYNFPLPRTDIFTPFCVVNVDSVAV